MKIVACYKCVPFSEEIGVKADRTLDRESASWEIGQYDLLAVETGMRLAVDGDRVAALTVGGEVLNNSKMKKAILSRGPAEMYGIQSKNPDDLDSVTTARYLKEGIEKIGDVELVICGEGSSDMYSQQVGNVLGAMLGWNTVNSVSAVERADSCLKVERTVDGGTEVLEVDYPAVLTVTSNINKARIPTMKDIMGAGKKPASVWAEDDVAEGIKPMGRVESMLAPESQERKRVILEGDSDEVVDEFAALIKNML